MNRISIAIFHRAKNKSPLSTLHITPYHIVMESSGKDNNLLSEEQSRLLDALKSSCPDATLEERIRFLRGKNYNLNIATKQLNAYLQWRRDHDLDDDKWNNRNDNGDDWKLASQKAFRRVNNHADHGAAVELPQILFTIQKGNKNACTEKDGDESNNQIMILHLIPALLDPKVAPLEVYSLTIAYYLDRQLDRHVDQAAYVLLDTRRGVGWPNTKAFALMSFIRQTISILQEMYPERLAKTIVFNLPWACKYLWEMVKPFLDPNTREKVVVCSGKDDPEAEPPQKVLCCDESIMTVKILERMEKMRRSLFAAE
mmetsp:Transcript_8438/g.12227  ORF Transcript_8438/g.12227 Transcript_8438/m.12227 type:complete len:313 (+) Transcript_8438:15-953(+)